METYEDIYESICRVCLSYEKSENMVCLTDKNSEDGLSSYGKAVRTFANICINNNDELPKRLCFNCLKILKHVIFFKLKCEFSDKILLKLSKMHKESSSNLKEAVVDYLLYKQYFPQNSSNNTPSTIATKNILKPVAEDGKNLVSVCDSAYLDKDNGSSSDDEKLVIDESNMDRSPCTSPETVNISSALEELDMIERIVTQSACIMPKNINIKHKNRKPKILPERKKTTPRKKLRRQIRSTEKPPDNLVCNICKKVLANQHTYRYHMERHNGCTYICEHCGKGFPIMVELQMHQVSQHGTGPYLQCPHCTYKAPRKLNLIEHIRLHTGERPFTCDKCGLTFRRSAIWKKHMVYHKEKTVECPHCPRKFYRRSEMLSHANNIHERLYVYLCHECDVTYTKTETVRKHLTERHGIPREAQGKITRVKKGEMYSVL